MARDFARQFSFSFGRPERLGQRLAFWMCHSRLYYNLIRPLKALLLKTGTLPWALRYRPLQFLLLPLAGRIKDRNLFPVRKACLKPECPEDDAPISPRSSVSAERMSQRRWIISPPLAPTIRKCRSTRPSGPSR
jgi:hypothetical protein